MLLRFVQISEAFEDRSNGFYISLVLYDVDDVD